MNTESIDIYLECSDPGVVKLIGTIPPNLSDVQMTRIARHISQLQRTMGVVGTQFKILTASFSI